jgi:hypothetical protein
MRKQFKGGRIYFGSQFQRSLGSVASGLLLKWNIIMAGANGGPKEFMSWHPGGCGIDRTRGLG